MDISLYSFHCERLTLDITLRLSGLKTLCLKPTSVPCLTNTKAEQSKANLKSQQINSDHPPNVPVSFNDNPGDYNADL